MERRILSGNEAIALGAWEAGVAVGTGYPGTPSTEILETLTRYTDVYTEWSVNEKVAMEVALGAAMTGARALVTMKHVGLNVAADPLFTAAYVGVKAGLVIACADDPAMHSSQNEQDSRHYAVAAKLPMLEPSDSQEAKDFTRLAFGLSERHDTPVILRSTTRLSHGKSIVVPAAEREEGTTSRGFDRDPRKWVMIPAHARPRHAALEARLDDLRRVADELSINVTEIRSPKLGFITSGICYTYVCEAFPDASVLKLGMVHPLPRARIAAFLGAVDEVYVVEELDPVLENAIDSLRLRPQALEGKSLYPTLGELNPTLVARPLQGRGHPSALRARTPLSTSFPVPPRPPSLCPGCPHRTVFTALNRLGVTVAGDIGCYTLGALPPFSAMDTCVDMGASLGVAQGMELALRGNPPAPGDGTHEGGGSGGGGVAGDHLHGRSVAVIGDSTFAHSGITGLLNAAYNGRAILTIVLDNGTTAMTGLQPNPLSGGRIDGKPAPALDYRKLAEAVGIADGNVRIVDAYKPAEVEAGIRDLLDRRELALLVVKGLCILLRKRKSKERAP